MSRASSYVIYRRTRDGRLRLGLRLPGWLPLAASLLILACAAHLAWRLPEMSRLYTLKRQVQAARNERAAERAKLLAVHESFGGLRRSLEPVATLNGKLASLASLGETSGEKRAMGSAGLVEDGFGNEKRLARQLSATSRALIEEIAFQLTRQRQLASIMHDRALEFAARPSLWPVHGPINSDFGYRYMSRSREFHKGVDIGTPTGTPVTAPADGRVAFAGYESGYGLMVVIEHRNGVSTVYAHLKDASVEEGDSVTRGERIALSGMSGRTTGSHLHYEVRVNGQPVDPMNYMLN